MILFISILITSIAFFGVMFLLGSMYCEFNERITKLEKRSGGTDEK